MARIINFHQIDNPVWFENTVKLLLSKYQSGRLEDVMGFYERKNQKIFFHITVDDGDISNYHTIYPILKKYNLTATIFVSPYMIKSEKNFWYQDMELCNHDDLRDLISDRFKVDRKLIQQFYVQSMFKNMRIDDVIEIIERCYQKQNISRQKRRNMNVKEILELHQSGHFTIGAHTNTHPILANEEDSRSASEIMNSVQELSDILNQKVEHFAYPNGDNTIDFSAREHDYLQKAGVRYAYSFDFKSLKKSDHPYQIPRFGLYNGSVKKVNFLMNYGELWSQVKNRFLNTETKHRLLIKKHINFLEK